MSIREFAVLLIMCAVWGFHFVVIKVAIGELPPMFYAAIRMTLVAMVMAPFLRWHAAMMTRVIAAAFCLGALNYALMFNGLGLATASGAALAMELYVPFATFLSVIFLGETIGWRRILGIALAFIGVAVIAVGHEHESGASAAFGIGIGMVVIGAFVEAVGAIFIKKVDGFKPFQLLAWFSLVGAVSLWMLTFAIETGQQQAWADADKTLIISAIIYSAIGGSIIGHGSFYWLLQRLPLSVVAPSTLLVTIFAIMSGILFLGDPFGPRLIIGALLAFAGVGLILLRNATKADNKKAIVSEEIAP